MRVTPDGHGNAFGQAVVFRGSTPEKVFLTNASGTLTGDITVLNVGN